MGLQELNDSLHKREGATARGQHPDAFDPTASAWKPQADTTSFQEKSWQSDQRTWIERHRKPVRIVSIVVGAMLLVALIVVAFVKIREAAFTDEKVKLSIDGPTEVGGSQSNRFTIVYTNTNRSDLSNAEMTVYYPDSFRPEGGPNILVKDAYSQVHIGTIDGHSEGKIDFPGKFFGSKGSVVYLRAVLHYKPDSVGSEFQSETQLAVTVKSSSLVLEIQSPLEAASGDKAEYHIDYTNTSDVPQNNLRLKVEYPDGFRFSEANPKTSEGDAVWYLGNVAPGQKGTIIIVGTLDGTRNEQKTVRAKIGTFQGNGDFLAYNETEGSTRMIASPLSIVQAVNGQAQLSASPGQLLNYVIRYRNDGEIGLRDVIVSLEIQGAALDFSRMRLQKGAYDSAHNMIRWKASDFPGLAYLGPGQGGSVDVSIPVLGSIPMATVSDKNFTIISTAKIDSPDVPTPVGSNKIIGSNRMSIKVNSSPSVQMKGLYQDALLPNSGPIPPKVGAETSYTLHWTLYNTTNDLDKVQVSAFLPTNVKWLGKTLPNSESVDFNPRTNQITWNVGSVTSGTGAFVPPRELSFQVAITPEAAQVGQTVTLIKEGTLTAHDLFTDADLSVGTAAKTTFLPEDTSLSASSFQVAP